MRLLLSTIAATAAMITTDAHAAPPLKLMPIDFVGEWCNGETIQGETNWKLPSWVEEDGKCTNILSVTKYDFSFEINGKPFSCVPDTIRQSQSTAPSGTSYQATIAAHCRGDGPVTGHGQVATFEFSRYKGNIYMKRK